MTPEQELAALRAHCRPTRWAYTGGRNREVTAVITEIGYDPGTNQVSGYEVHTRDGEPICRTKTLASAARAADDYSMAIGSWETAHISTPDHLRPPRPGAWELLQAYRDALKAREK